jgi:hypothetical protein
MLLLSLLLSPLVLSKTVKIKIFFFCLYTFPSKSNFYVTLVLKNIPQCNVSSVTYALLKILAVELCVIYVLSNVDIKI